MYINYVLYESHERYADFHRVGESSALVTYSKFLYVLLNMCGRITCVSTACKHKQARQCILLLSANMRSARSLSGLCAGQPYDFAQVFIGFQKREKIGNR